MSSLKLDALAAVLLLKEKGTATAAPAAAMPPAQDAYEAVSGASEAEHATRWTVLGNVLTIVLLLAGW
jgi:hypothetical protein